MGIGAMAARRRVRRNGRRKVRMHCEEQGERRKIPMDERGAGMKKTSELVVLFLIVAYAAEVAHFLVFVFVRPVRCGVCSLLRGESLHIL